MSEKLNILVVDDEDMILKTFREYLETSRDYTIFTARDGLEALDIINKEKVDCCFTDLSMPKMDGINLTRKIQEYDNTIPVVVMTGYPSMENAIRTLKHGVVDFLTKPVKMEEVSLIIDRAMRERSLLIDNLILKEEVKKKEELLKLNRELQEKISEMETMNMILRELDKVSNSRDLFNMLVDLSGSITPCDEAHFCIFGQEVKDPVTISSYYRQDKEKTGVEAGDEDGEIPKREVIEKIMVDEMPIIIKKRGRDRNTLAVPLKIKSRIFGALVLHSYPGDGARSLGEKDLYFLNFLAEKASYEIENMALYENIYENLFSTLYAFVETIEARDPYTKEHSKRVTDYAISIARAMNCSYEELDILNVSGNLHDIGKVGVPDSILLKPGSLTKDEYEAIKKHPVIGASIIGHFGMLAEEKKVIKGHHERWDGNGYPDGLKGKDIPLLSRIISVADVYDALTSDRSYRKKMPKETAVNIIKESSGTQFDPRIVDVFLSIFNK